METFGTNWLSAISTAKRWEPSSFLREKMSFVSSVRLPSSLKHRRPVFGSMAKPYCLM